MSLSDKVEYCYGTNPKIKVLDFKVFIKKLKKQIRKEVKYCKKMLGTEHGDIATVNKTVFNMMEMHIDELAGEKLV